MTSEQKARGWPSLELREEAVRADRMRLDHPKAQYGTAQADRSMRAIAKSQWFIATWHSLPAFLCQPAIMY